MARPDYILLSVVGILILLGIVTLTGVSAVLSQEKFGSSTFFLSHHLLFGLLPGIALGFLAFRISLAFFKKWAPVLVLANLFLMVLVFVPKIGMSFGGASRWINLGIISFQPSEFLKLSFILYLAAWLNTLKIKAKNLSNTLIAFLIILGVISLLLILQPDISTLAIIVISGVFMYFSAGTLFRHNFLIGAAAIAGLLLLVKISSYRLDRFLVFLKPELDPMGISYQIKQALIAVGSGGIWGRGLGTSALRFIFLPQPMADSIFAIFSEEIGFIGSVILILLFLIFAWQGFKIAKKSRNGFYKFSAVGISSWITLQALINIGAMVGVLPLTGIPLPFISYGGSAMIAELIGVGILLNISKHT